MWEPPEEDQRNGEIVSYTVCVSHMKKINLACFKKYTTTEKMLLIRNLNASTKYYIRVRASTEVGPGVYSEGKGEMTNSGKCSSLLQKSKSFGKQTL